MYIYVYTCMEHFHTSDQWEMPLHECDIVLALECYQDIRTDISVYISLRHSTNPTNCLIAK